MTQIKLSVAERKALVLKILRYMDINPAYRAHVESKIMENAYRRYSNESQT